MTVILDDYRLPIVRVHARTLCVGKLELDAAVACLVRVARFASLVWVAGFGGKMQWAPLLVRQHSSALPSNSNLQWHFW